MIGTLTANKNKHYKDKETLHPNNWTENFDVIGHVPKLIATWLNKFLKKPSNYRNFIIKGKRINRGGGYGLLRSEGRGVSMSLAISVGCSELISFIHLLT